MVKGITKKKAEVKSREMKVYFNEEIPDQPFPDLTNYEDIQYRPEKLGDINRGEGQKLTGIDASGNLINDVINARLDTSTKQILDVFKLTSSGALNISGTQTSLTANAAVGDTSITVDSTTNFPSSGVLYLQGNTNWMRITYTGTTTTTFTGIPASGTGSITEAADSGKQVLGGPGVIITPKGIVTINSDGKETITLEGLTGDATFAGELSAVTGTLGTLIIASGGYIKTAESGQRTEIVSDKLNFYASDGTLRSSIYGTLYELLIDSNLTVKCTVCVGDPNGLGTGLAVSGDNAWDIGSSGSKFRSIYVNNSYTCDLPTINSAINIFKKIKEPVLQPGNYGLRKYFKVKDFPTEMKSKNDKKEDDIELTRTLGVTVQAVRELIEKVEQLENKLK